MKILRGNLNKVSVNIGCVSDTDWFDISFFFLACTKSTGLMAVKLTALGRPQLLVSSPFSPKRAEEQVQHSQYQYSIVVVYLQAPTADFLRCFPSVRLSTKVHTNYRLGGFLTTLNNQSFILESKTSDAINGLTGSFTIGYKALFITPVTDLKKGDH